MTGYRTFFLSAALLLAGPAGAAEPAPAPRPAVDRVLLDEAVAVVSIAGCAHDGEAGWAEYRRRLARAEALRPAFEHLLANTRTDPGLIRLAFLYLGNAGLGGPRLRELALDRLADPEPIARLSAARYLGRVGGPLEAPTLLVLLSDREGGVGRAAAEALARVGGPGELAGMNLWLKSGAAHRYDAEHLARVRKCRDELERRLKAGPDPKGVKN